MTAFCNFGLAFLLMNTLFCFHDRDAESLLRDSPVSTTCQEKATETYSNPDEYEILLDRFKKELPVVANRFAHKNEHEKYYRMGIDFTWELMASHYLAINNQRKAEFCIGKIRSETIRDLAYVDMVRHLAESDVDIAISTALKLPADAFLPSTSHLGSSTEGLRDFTLGSLAIECAAGCNCDHVLPILEKISDPDSRYQTALYAILNLPKHRLVSVGRAIRRRYPHPPQRNPSSYQYLNVVTEIVLSADNAAAGEIYQREKRRLTKAGKSSSEIELFINFVVRNTAGTTDVLLVSRFIGDISHNEDKWEALRDAVDHLLKLGKYNEAETLIELHPHSYGPDAIVNSYLRHNRLDHALRVQKKIDDLEDAASALLNICERWTFNKTSYVTQDALFSSVKKWYSERKKKEINDPEIQALVACCYAFLGEKQKSEDRIKNALEIMKGCRTGNSVIVEVHNLIGKAYRVMNNRSEALKYQKLALKYTRNWKYPDIPTARELLRLGEYELLNSSLGNEMKEYERVNAYSSIASEMTPEEARKLFKKWPPTIKGDLANLKVRIVLAGKAWEWTASSTK